MYSFNLIYFNRNDNILFNISSKGYFTSSMHVNSFIQVYRTEQDTKSF